MENITQFCSLILCLCLATTTIAQTIPELQNHKIISGYELTAGLGLLKSATYYDNGNKVGYSLGVGVFHNFSKTFELKVRALYELKGSNTETRALFTKGDETTDVTRHLSTNLHYATAAVMSTFHLLKNKRLLLGAGGFYSVMTSIKVSEDRTDNDTGITTHINHSGGNTSYYTDQRDFGLSAYTGYTVNLSKKTDLALMLHYNKSLTDFNDGQNIWQRNNVILFSTTFTYHR
jgi:hypothetical protein